MGAVVVIVPDKRGDQSFQMGLVEGNHVIQQFATASPDPSFRDSILPRTTDGCLKCLEVHRSNGSDHLGAVLGVVIKNQVLALRLVREGFAQLLRDPNACRMASDVEMDNSSSIMSNDEEAIEHTKGDGRHREEVHGGDGFAMIA